MCNKIPYETISDALRGAKIVNSDVKRHQHTKPGKPKGNLRPYSCTECGKWHLTTAQKMNRKRRKTRWSGKQKEALREKWR